MTQQEIISRTRDYIRENFLYTRPDYPIEEDDNLMGKGIVDSMGMVELITFLQDTFAVKPSDDEITEDNFATLGRIADYVLRKSGGDAKPAAAA
ncbi:MAG TPA: acyl carrier protein [Gemmatimonadaceae bacterium]|nr:acyl carrier protein [Gemmatimonadaceae bacterium]